MNSKSSEHQSGNKKRHSCETLPVLMADSVLEAMDARKLTVVVLLHVSKAFDSVCHKILLSELQTLGVLISVQLLNGLKAIYRNGDNTSGLVLRP